MKTDTGQQRMPSAYHECFLQMAVQEGAKSILEA